MTPEQLAARVQQICRKVVPGMAVEALKMEGPHTGNMCLYLEAKCGAWSRIEGPLGGWDNPISTDKIIELLAGNFTKDYESYSAWKRHKLENSPDE